MKQVAIRDCQIIRELDNKIITLRRGEVLEFNGDNPNFRKIESEVDPDVESDIEPVDFITAGKDELLARTDWTKEDIVDFTKSYYDQDISRNKKRTSLVQAFLDAKARYVEIGA